jgi:mannose-6-phosphate isomerase-like protein (cupin superfamily)
MASEMAQYPFLSKLGEGEILVKAGLRLKVSSTQTGGAFEVVELAGPGFPPPHIHRDHDECFYIINGIFTFTIGTHEVEAPADSVVFIPRGTPHAFKHSEAARAILFVIPAQLEGFFRELGEGLAAGRSETDLRAVLAGKYDSWPVGSA